MVDREIIIFNGQLELNKEWKKKYVSTFYPLLKQIPIKDIFTYEVSLRLRAVLLAIRVFPQLYPVLRSMKRALASIMHK